MGDRLKPPPPDWGRSKLTQHLTDAEENSWATFSNLKTKPFFSALEDLNEVFETLLNNLDRPPKHLHLSTSFVMRAYSAHLAAVRLVSASQVTETYPVLRNALEWAGYGLLFSVDTEMAEAWRDRKTDKNAGRKIRNEGWSKAKESLVAESERLGGAVKDAYELTIDYGAHPNLLGLADGMEFESSTASGRVINNFFQGDEPPLYYCLHRTYVIGLILLDVSRRLFRHRTSFILLRGQSIDDHFDRLHSRISTLSKLLPRPRTSK